jgi:hypothetical protein
VVYIILGMLYESYIHPLTILSTLPSAGVGALLMLLIVSFRSVGDRADRHHPADRHRQEERHHDGGFRDAGRARAAPGARGGDPQACLLRFRPIMMTTMAALLGALPLMLGTAPARSCASRSGIHHGRRPDAEPGAHAVYDAGDLSVSWISSAAPGGARAAEQPAAGRPANGSWRKV